MLENDFLKKFNDLNTSLNNTNTFLLDISLPLINYLLTKNNDFEELFEKACHNNIRFAAKTLEQDLFEKTDDFLICMSETGGCSCHDRNWTAFHQEIVQPLHEYCLFLCIFVDKNDFNEKLIATLSDFGNDYRAIHSDLLNKRMDLTRAEQSVLYWHDAIPDIPMQEAILQLRYDYLKKLLSAFPS